METTKLKRFAQHARKNLIKSVEIKLDEVLQEGSRARRESSLAVKKLEQEINNTLKEQVVEKVAYIWFNRFIALRFMDVNRFSKVNIVSPEPGQFQPSILSDAKMGHIDESIVNEKTKEKVLAFLENRSPSSDPQGEAYKLLVVAACNYYNTSMPFLFERIEDYTELLMPKDLLSGDSILAYTREAMTPDVCKDIEVIGWLYQFYISEKKDEVFEGIKKNKKVTPENIPAATQLFTPNWIVRYMVENSLGRLWKLNNPNSSLHMEYYIEPETKESDYLKISSPTELKICDPACGSGHILVYAFDLLYEIYKEAGYTDDDTIVENIIQNNLYGIEIDERAAELAAFALTMKAASKSGSKRRFFRNTIEPNICKLEKIKFEDDEIDSYMDIVGRDLFTEELSTTLTQFEEADNFGSLIVPALQDVKSILERLKESNVTDDLFLAPIHEKVLKVLEQTDYLSSKYHVVVANPPYMGNKGINPRLGVFLKENYDEVKMDLFSAFVVRCSNLGILDANIGIMSPNTWMYISSYERLRHYLLKQKTLTTLIELPLSGFKGATVQICSYTFINRHYSDLKGGFIRLVDFKGGDEEMASYTKKAVSKKSCEYLFEIQSELMSLVPDMPIMYDASENVFLSFKENGLLGDLADVKRGMTTSDNNQFLRFWCEVSMKKCKFNAINHDEAFESESKWFPYSKGGGYRKWYGFNEYLINWEENGRDVINFAKTINNSYTRTIVNIPYYFMPSVGFSYITTGPFSMRWINSGFLYDSGGPGVFTSEHNRKRIIACMNSKPALKILKHLNPTVNLQIADVVRLPIPNFDELNANDFFEKSVNKLTLLSKRDWDAYETSWDFTSLEILQMEFKKKSIQETYNLLREFWKSQVEDMKKFEEENNNIFIKAYRLEEELKTEVPLKEITLTCNPPYRYDAKKSEEELEALLLTDTIKEYISYAVGIMLGRYSLDHEGLHIANQDENIEEVNERFNISKPTFEADDDNVIPILDGDWFTDDISERFFQFVKVTFGEETYEENIDFIADALNPKNKNSIETIRKYFIKDFYPDHIKRYKKRPIYWMFSSQKGSFQALIYMHRYKSDTVSVILNDYLRNFITKLEATKDNLEAASIKSDTTKAEKVKAIKEIEKIKKMILECQEYADEVIFPLATRPVEEREIDLDNGVKHNYPLFGKALKKVTGLN